MKNSILPRTALLLLLPLSTVCHSTAIVNSLSDELMTGVISQGFNALPDMMSHQPPSLDRSELEWSVGDSCGYRSKLACLVQSDQKSLFTSNNRLYLGSKDLGSLRVLNVFSEDIATGVIDYLYMDEAAGESTEVPVPAVGMHLMATALFMFAAAGRKRRQCDHAQH